MVEPIDTVPAGSVRAGDDPARLGEFFDRAMGELFPYLSRRCGHDRSTAEDLTQETFVQAVRALREGRIEHLTVGWLITCAQSRFIDHCRRESRRERHLSLVTPTGSDGVEDDVISGSVVADLLIELPATQRMVVVLHHLDGLPVPEIAERTGRSVRAVESLLARARRTLRQHAEEESDDG